MELECCWPCAQQPTNHPYRELFESNPHLPFLRYILIKRVIYLRVVTGFVDYFKLLMSCRSDSLRAGGLGIEPLWKRYFPCLVPRPNPLLSLLYSGYCVFPRVKRPGLCANHPPLLGPSLREFCNYTFTSPLHLRRHVMGWHLPSCYVKSSSGMPFDILCCVESSGKVVWLLTWWVRW